MQKVTFLFPIFKHSGLHLCPVKPLTLGAQRQRAESLAGEIGKLFTERRGRDGKVNAAEGKY